MMLSIMVTDVIRDWSEHKTPLNKFTKFTMMLSINGLNHLSLVQLIGWLKRVAFVYQSWPLCNNFNRCDQIHLKYKTH